MLGGKRINVGISKRTGHFGTNFDLDAQTVSENTVETPYGQKLCFESMNEDVDSRPLTAKGSVQLVQASGLSVISDIDDTVKLTNVADPPNLVMAIEALHAFPPVENICFFETYLIPLLGNLFK